MRFRTTSKGRKPCDRRVRLLSCSRRARIATTRFSWAGGLSARFRRGIPLLLRVLLAVGELPSFEEAEIDIAAELMLKYFGRHWRYRFRESIGRLADGDSPGTDL